MKTKKKSKLSRPRPVLRRKKKGSMSKQSGKNKKGNAELAEDITFLKQQAAIVANGNLSPAQQEASGKARERLDVMEKRLETA